MPSPTQPQLRVHCLCHTHTFTTPLPSRPLLASVCHCTSCRHVTGGLYTACTPWPTPSSSVDVSRLSRYAFTSNADLLFCDKCSTPLFWETGAGLKVLTGVLEGEGVVVEYTEQCFVSDTTDGGASVWLRNVRGDGRALQCYTQKSDSEVLDRDWVTNPLTAHKEESIPIQCHCRGVDFTLHRADYTDTPATDIPWYIDPTSHRLLADFCGCASCRLQSGVDAWYWAFAGIGSVSFGAHISSLSSITELKVLIDDHVDIGTLAYYASSAGVLRFFCKRCSACVFYSEDGRPEMLDIAVGLLEATEGARAEDWLAKSYGERLSWHENVKGTWREPLWNGIEGAAKDWRARREHGGG